jgi:hypothetical protein
MFVSQSVLKVLLRENARLSRELRRKDQVILELIDRFVNNRIPQRLQPDVPTIFNSPNVTTSYPSDAYSQAIEDAERRAALPDLSDIEADD